MDKGVLVMENKKFKLSIKADNDKLSAEEPTERALEVIIQAPDTKTKKDRLPLNLALVVDRSGSMSGGKLEYVKQAANHVLDQLQKTDRAAIVDFDNQITVLSESLELTDENRRNMKSKLGRLNPRGSTALFDGWARGSEQAAAHQDDRYINRTLLLSDGQANQGLTDLEQIGIHVRELHKRGISTSTFGVGHGFNENLLENMANRGGGNFYYIEHPSEIPAIFRRELDEILEITASGVVLDLTIPKGTKADVLGDYEHSLEKGRLTIQVGDLPAGMRKEIYLRVLTSAAEIGEEISFEAEVSAKDLDGKSIAASADLKFVYVSQEDLNEVEVDEALLQRFSQVELADATAEALILEKQGELERSSEMLLRAAEKRRTSLPADEYREARALSKHIKRRLSVEEQKSHHYGTYLRKRRREE
jgi:Ca-activated chloride channel family protein